MIKYKDKNGEKHKYNADEKTVKAYALANVEQLLQIALSSSNAYIDDRFGGEHELLDLIHGYLAIYLTLEEDVELPFDDLECRAGGFCDMCGDMDCEDRE